MQNGKLPPNKMPILNSYRKTQLDKVNEASLLENPQRLKHANESRGCLRFGTTGMICIKHLSNFVTMEPFVHLFELVFCCHALGHIPLIRLQIKKSKPSSMRTKTFFCFIPCYMPSTLQMLSNYQLSKQMSACTNEQNKSNLVRNTEHTYMPRCREGQGLCGSLLHP